MTHQQQYPDSAAAPGVGCLDGCVSHRQRRSLSASRLLSVIFSIGIALTALGAVYKPEVLGYLGASPSVLLIGASLLLLPLIARPLWYVESRYAAMLLWYGLAISVPSLFIFGVVSIYFTKMGTLLILCAIWLSPLLCSGHLRRQDIERGLYAALLISVIGYLLCDFFRVRLPPAIDGLVFGGGFDDHSDLRPHAFMQESSHFAVLVGRYLVILFLLREATRTYSATRLAFFMIGLTVLLASLGSKGAAISVLVAVLSVSFTRRQLPFLVILLPVVWWVGSSQVTGVAYDIENYTSVSTRVTLLLTSLTAVINNPLGYGYYGFYGAVQHFGGWSMGWLSNQVTLNFVEVAEIVEQLKNVSMKSTLLDFSMIFGAPFVLMLIAMVRRIRLSDPRARTALVYFLLTAMSTSGHESISFFLGLTILLHFYPKFVTISSQQPVKKICTATLPRPSTASVKFPAA